MFGKVVGDELDISVSPHINPEQALAALLKEWKHQNLPKSIIVGEEVELTIAQQVSRFPYCEFATTAQCITWKYSEYDAGT